MTLVCSPNINLFRQYDDNRVLILIAVVRLTTQQLIIIISLFFKK
jgi:hypothetical protein